MGQRGVADIAKPPRRRGYKEQRTYRRVLCNTRPISMGSSPNETTVKATGQEYFTAGLRRENNVKIMKLVWLRWPSRCQTRVKPRPSYLKTLLHREVAGVLVRHSVSVLKNSSDGKHVFFAVCVDLYSKFPVRPVRLLLL